MKLWHGTSTRYIERILDEGLRPDTSCYGHVCLSSDAELSRYFGSEMAAWEKGEMVLLSMDLDDLDADSLCHEMGWIGNSLDQEDGEACLGGTPSEMLERHKVVGYRKTIQPALLRLEEAPEWVREKAASAADAPAGP